VDASDPSEERAPHGSLHGLGATLLALVRTRVALAGVELREETQRAVGLLLLAGTALLFFGAALVVAALLVAAAFRDTHPVLALAGMTALYATIGIAILLRIRTSLKAAPLPFAASVQEFEDDLALLGDRHE
jgi:uncharacterized membrane protein YqjE